MAELNATITEELVSVAKALRDAPHGEKGQIIDAAAQRLQMARATLHRHLKSVSVSAPRRRRSDAGQVALPLAEAKLISALLMEHMRKNGKMLKSVDDAVSVLRANEMIDAQRIDPASGEVVPLSTSAILNALRTYRLHPEQLLAPAPATSMRSLHPNHVWQVDASRCVLYYLPARGKDNGLRVAEEDKFYKNKPDNVIRAIKESIWRYVVTDHTSGWLYAEYVTGGETAVNLVGVVIRAMCQRDREAMYGVPRMIMLDPGSANTAAAFRNLCNSLGVDVQINKPGNPRAKGQVEKGQDITERSLESTFKLLPPDQVDTTEKINDLARRWRRWFNGEKRHTRHGMTRDSAWLHITPDQLVIPPSAEVLHSLALTEPESRVVSPKVRVSYRGADYDVSAVPNVIIGQRVLVCTNPWREDAVQIVGADADGNKVFHVAERVTYDQFGMVADAPVIGESYARHADTPAQVNRKELELLATGASTEDEAKAIRKARGPLFGGQIDPFKHIDDAVVPATMPRRGRKHDLVAPPVHLPPLTHIQAAKQLKRLIAGWSTEHYVQMQAMYPDGVPSDAIEQAADRVRAAMNPITDQSTTTHKLRVA